MTVATTSELARHDGRLAHDDVGQGPLAPLLLIHGWGCDATFLAAQAAHFSRSRRVVSVDLPGHGRSRVVECASTMGAFAEAVARLCESIDLSGAVVVGHSMGGAVGIELASQAPALVSALVLLDTLLFPAPEMRQVLVGMADQLRSADRLPALDQAAAALSIPVDDPTMATRYRASLGTVPPDVAADTFAAHLLDYQPEQALSAFHKPIAYIGAETPFADVAKLKGCCPNLKVGQVLGSGHFAPVLVPDQVNALMAGFLAAYVDHAQPAAHES